MPSGEPNCDTERYLTFLVSAPMAIWDALFMDAVNSKCVQDAVNLLWKDKISNAKDQSEKIQENRGCFENSDKKFTIFRSKGWTMFLGN